MLSPKSYPISCHFPSSFRSPVDRQNPKPRSLPLSRIPILGARSRLRTLIPRRVLGIKPVTLPLGKRGLLQICRDSVEREDFEPGLGEEEKVLAERSGDGGGSDWTSSVLLFGLWAGLMYYVFQLAPDQTPVTVAAGMGIIIYAGLADGDMWEEFYQYFRESKFVSSKPCIYIALYSSFWL
ncbi:hypothetical protein BHM03_00055516 [Ensete ventricosum]|nr:hypothetical protein BHM03_00055516 [Ensete ventricosum]